MAFTSYHYEKAFEEKALAYILEAGTSLNVVEKKWIRVPDKTKDWAWGNVEGALTKQDGLNAEQKTRFDEVKVTIGK